MTNNSKSVSQYILDNIEKYPSTIAIVLARKYSFSRQRASEYIRREVAKGNLIKIGDTSSTRYFLTDGNHIEFVIKIKSGIAEDAVWVQYIKPMILKFPENIRAICIYGFTEILNNALDHSNGTTIFCELKIHENEIIFVILDNGIGIYKKIKDAMHLESEREAILHLSKGKFTTDPKNHSGEGIFFTSRIFDKFSISSEDLFYSFKGTEWLLSPEHKKDFGQGTLIEMCLNIDSVKTTKGVMDKYADAEIGFFKTIVAVALSADPQDPHVSRSQAKRLLMGLNKFKNIVLDFHNVSSVGQAFVDEIFRVFQNEYPDIKLQYINTSKEVEEVIKRGLKISKSN